MQSAALKGFSLTFIRIYLMTSLQALLNMFLIKLLQYEPGLVLLIKSMVMPQHVPLTMQHVQHDDDEGIIFNKKAFAVAKEFTDQQVNLHHRQQFGLATALGIITEATPLLQFDVVAFLLAEIVHDFDSTSMKLKWDAVVLVGRELEVYLVKLFRCALLCANHGGRAGLLPKDLQLARRILGERA